MSLAELEKAVRDLSKDDFEKFSSWLDEYSAAKWDSEFEKDASAGSLNHLAREADGHFEGGRCTPL